MNDRQRAFMHRLPFVLFIAAALSVLIAGVPDTLDRLLARLFGFLIAVLMALLWYQIEGNRKS